MFQDGCEYELLFESENGLRQWCGMSPWLFNMYEDQEVREVQGRTEEGGVNMIERDQSECILS